MRADLLPNRPNPTVPSVSTDLLPSPAVDPLDLRALRYAALGDVLRLQIVDELCVSDRSPIELRRLLNIESNLMTHHLDILEGAGLVVRSRSSSDGRRRYVRLSRVAYRALQLRPTIQRQRASFICTANSARSQLAAALWRSITGASADSAGTHPADRVHPGALAAAQRFGLDLNAAKPRPMSPTSQLPALVVTVCDRAHEELGARAGWVHWSIPDPVPQDTTDAFNATVRELTERIQFTITPAADLK